MDWDKLKIFHAVAEAGSFTNATVNLNLSQSAISRQIQSLEQDLKVQLFERHARGLTLTENGEYVFKTAHEVISKLKEVETSLGDQKNKPTGKTDHKHSKKFWYSLVNALDSRIHEA
jgi:Transcriptional regulator